MSKKKVCRACGSKDIIRKDIESLGLDSVLRKEVEVECLSCKNRYTE